MGEKAAQIYNASPFFPHLVFPPTPKKRFCRSGVFTESAEEGKKKDVSAFRSNPPEQLKSSADRFHGWVGVETKYEV